MGGTFWPSLDSCLRDQVLIDVSYFALSIFQRMREQWRPAHFRTIKTGHVSGILLEQAAYRKTIMEVVGLLRNEVQ